ncbi:MAG: response regulator [Candidatus Margulisbacteria bacterium]|nr:response regulator [Candidatus Margulisiibacteriota bacterium]
MGLRRKLEAHGYTVVGHETYAEKAIDRVVQAQPDLVLMDIMLKGEMNGVQASKEILSKIRLPIVFLTAYSDNKTFSEAKEISPYAYILKPYSERELLCNIEIALHKFELELQLDQKSEALEKSLKDYKDLMHVAAHDLKVPLTTLNGLVYLLEEEGSIKPEGEEHFKHLKKVLDTSFNVVRSLNEDLAIKRGGKKHE